MARCELLIELWFSVCAARFGDALSSSERRDKGFFFADARSALGAPAAASRDIGVFVDGRLTFFANESSKVAQRPVTYSPTLVESY